MTVTSFMDDIVSFDDLIHLQITAIAKKVSNKAFLFIL